MRLVLDIAWTHVTSRLRQTLVGILGVAMGVGFSVMMAALMEGSQRDFVDQLVDSIPHITVSDDRRNPPVQPAELAYDAVAISGLTTAAIRPGRGTWTKSFGLTGFASAGSESFVAALSGTLMGRSARDFMSSRVRYPLRSRARRWSLTPFVDRIPMCAPISRNVGG